MTHSFNSWTLDKQKVSEYKQEKNTLTTAGRPTAS